MQTPHPNQQSYVDLYGFRILVFLSLQTESIYDLIYDPILHLGSPGVWAFGLILGVQGTPIFAPEFDF